MDASGTYAAAAAQLQRERDAKEPGGFSYYCYSKGGRIEMQPRGLVQTELPLFREALPEEMVNAAARLVAKNAKKTKAEAIKAQT